MIRNLTRFYKQLDKLMVPGICAFVHEKSKRVYILYSINLLEAILRTVKDRNYINFQVFILLDNLPPDELKVEASWWIVDYRNRGYTVLNKQLPAIYKIKVEINRDYLVDVILKPRRAKGKVLKTFANMDEAKAYAIEQAKKYELS